MAKRWAVGESTQAVPSYPTIDKVQTEALAELHQLSSILVDDLVTIVPAGQSESVRYISICDVFVHLWICEVIKCSCACIRVPADEHISLGLEMAYLRL